MALLQNTSDNIPAVDINPESEIIEKMESPTKAGPESLTSGGKDMDFAAMEPEENADKKEEQVAEKAETDVSEEPAKEPSSAEEPNAKEATPTKEEEKKSPAKTSPKKSSVKKDNKKKENQENDEEAAEQEEDEHEVEMHEQKKGIFDMPLEVEGKRERHKVERISIGTPSVKKAPTELKMGNGVPLGDIAYTAQYDEEDLGSSQRRKHKGCTGTVSFFVKFLVISENFVDDSFKVTTIMVFMMKTVDHERKVPGKKRRSTAKTPTAKRSRKSKGSDEKKESETKETSPKTDSDSDSSEAAKKKTKKTTKKNRPSEQELETVIEELLSTFDLAQVSMKQMCQAVIERFPGTNIGNRVDFLKSKIKQCLSTK
ncbi:DEK protein [Ancylostoma duodenale]|uniref:DEK protein n=1 Tax=Ancylostoma duodenale TaxID=51022 RepID=A0A0C2D5V4_9BILA|nr:DEK protein [Ancylostoma duodenale]